MAPSARPPLSGQLLRAGLTPLQTCCAPAPARSPACLQVVFDSQPPNITSLVVTAPPTADSPLFEVAASFSEPVWWAADANASDATATGGSSSSGRLVLTNAALLNISVAPGAAAALADGTPSGAASGFRLWLRSQAGAHAAVEVTAAAYQDAGGNRGAANASLQVRARPGAGTVCCLPAVAPQATCACHAPR